MTPITTSEAELKVGMKSISAMIAITTQNYSMASIGSKVLQKNRISIFFMIAFNRIHEIDRSNG